jgi:hypothetical protein
MRFFTPQRYVALQAPGKAEMDAADADWENAVERYESLVQTLRPHLPEPVRRLLDGYYLHDADVLSIGRQGEHFVLQLQLDVPPHELLTLRYDLAADPDVDVAALPPEHRSTGMQWLHDELEQVGETGNPSYLHSILFSNGWEVRIPFRDVQLSTAQPVYPVRQGAPAAWEMPAVRPA